MSVSAQERCQRGSVGTIALDAKRKDLAERVRPSEKLLKATRVGGDGELRQDAAEEDEYEVRS